MVAHLISTTLIVRHFPLSFVILHNFLYHEKIIELFIPFAFIAVCWAHFVFMLSNFNLDHHMSPSAWSLGSESCPSPIKCDTVYSQEFTSMYGVIFLLWITWCICPHFLSVPLNSSYLCQILSQWLVLSLISDHPNWSDVGVSACPFPVYHVFQINTLSLLNAFGAKRYHKNVLLTDKIFNLWID